MTKKNKGRAKKNNKKEERLEDVEVNKAPHTFVFSRGHVGSNVQQLTLDLRSVMEPYTASNLKVTKKNVLKDFVAVAGPLGVTHLVSFAKTTNGLNMRLVRLPRGPTLYFKVHSYCLKRDIVSQLKKPKCAEGQYRHSPLLVLNDFTKAETDDNSNPLSINPQQLCSTMIQNMFPSINVHKVDLNNVKRCVMFNHLPESGRIEFRHYNITVKAVGISRKMKKLITQKDAPNMGRCNDVSEFLINQGDGSASDSELDVDDPNNKVELPQKMDGKGNQKNRQSAVRLTELGPRMLLELFKIEEGMCQGDIIYHKFEEKTPEEIEAAKKARENKQSAKKTRKIEQEQNIKRKEEEKELNKKRSLLGMKRKLEDSDDDAKWYKEEVGEEIPEDELPKKKTKVFTKKRNPDKIKQKTKSEDDKSFKKKKFDHAAKKINSKKSKMGSKPKFPKRSGKFKK